MARKPNMYVQLDGPLFDTGMIRLFNGAVFAGIEEIADEADDIMMAQISAGGLVDTGALLRSVDIITKRSSQDVIGYAKIEPTDVWQGSVSVKKIGTKRSKYKTKGKYRKVGVYSVSTSTSTSRPPKTWLSKGIRSGKKLTKGYDIFARTATAVRRLDTQERVAKHIAEALN